MRAVVMRVTHASVRVADHTAGEIGPGLLVLLGVERGDSAHDVTYLATKVANLRVFDGPDGAWRSAREIHGTVLVVSQFTLLGDVRRGRRPDFGRAAPGPEAEPLIDEGVQALRALNLSVATGIFGAHMQVESVNDGPYTLLVETRRPFSEANGPDERTTEAAPQGTRS